jgi:hypothetical protein
MKKIFLVLLVVLVFSSLGFAAEERLIIGTGGLAGTYYPLGSAIAAVITEFVDGASCNSQTSAAGVENARLLKLGDIDFGLVQTSAAYQAVHGEKVFKGDQIKDLRGLAILYPQPMQIVVAEESDIYTFEDLLGKRVGIGAPASGEEVTFKEVIGVAGHTIEDYKPHYISLAEQASAFKDRNIDMMWIVGGIPISAILDVASVRDVRFVPIDGALKEAIIKEYPYHAPGLIPAGTYPGQDEDIETLASPAYLVTTSRLSEDLVYNVLSALFDNLDVLQRAHAQGKNVTLEGALVGSPIPLHPGAEKYYKEKGILK